MSLKQRTQPTQSSKFLKKFKGKTTIVGKDGLSGLFNATKPKTISSISLHNSTHFNKENIESRESSYHNHRLVTHTPYTVEPIELERSKLTLPKINSREASEEARHRGSRKIFSQYNKMRKESKLRLDDDANKYPYEEALCNKYPWRGTYTKELRQRLQ